MRRRSHAGRVVLMARLLTADHPRPSSRPDTASPSWADGILWALFACHLVAIGIFPVHDTDTWWHLSQGRFYVDNGLAVSDPFSYTTEGNEWVKFSWAADTLYYLTWRSLGFDALVILRFLILAAVMAILHALGRRAGLAPAMSIPLLVMASLAMQFRLLIRPESVSFLALGGTMVVLFALKGLPVWGAYLLLLPQLLWVNVHASFVFGIAIPGLVLVTNLLHFGLLEPGWGLLKLDRSRILHLGVAVALLPLVTLLTPNRWGLLTFPFRQNSMVHLEAFYEWMSLRALPRLHPSLWEVVVVVALVLLGYLGVTLFLVRKERRLDPVALGLVASMGVYAVLHNRAVPFFFIAFVPVLAASLAQAARHLGPDSGRLRRGRALAGLLLVGVVATRVLGDPLYHWGFGATREVPEAGCRFLEREGLDGRVFNSYDNGGYLIWRRFPRNLVFIDGRYDAVLYPESQLEAYMSALKDVNLLTRLCRSWGVEILVMTPGQLDPAIWGDRRWTLVFWDPWVDIFVATEGRYAALATSRGFREVRGREGSGYLAALRSDPAAWQRAIEELRRAAADSPDNWMAWTGLAQELSAVTPDDGAGRLEALTRLVELTDRGEWAAARQAERAYVLMGLDRTAEARAAAEDALAMDPGQTAAHRLLAAVGQRTGDPELARLHLRALIDQLPPDDPQLPTLQGRLRDLADP